jgi:hypothetical protein
MKCFTGTAVCPFNQCKCSSAPVNQKTCSKEKCQEVCKKNVQIRTCSPAECKCSSSPTIPVPQKPSSSIRPAQQPLCDTAKCRDTCHLKNSKSVGNCVDGRCICIKSQPKKPSTCSNESCTKQCGVKRVGKCVKAGPETTCQCSKQ